jgi:hypothetical protein
MVADGASPSGWGAVVVLGPATAPGTVRRRRPAAAWPVAGGIHEDRPAT